jgi:hypothetical protein
VQRGSVHAPPHLACHPALSPVCCLWAFFSAQPSMTIPARSASSPNPKVRWALPPGLSKEGEPMGDLSREEFKNL